MTKQQIKDYLVARTVDEMTGYLMEDFHLELADALDVIYNSDTYQKLEDGETGLYEQSPAYTYEFLTKEYLAGHTA